MLRNVSHEWAKVKSNPLALSQLQQHADNKNAEKSNCEQSAAEKKCALLAIKKKMCALVSVQTELDLIKC